MRGGRSGPMKGQQGTDGYCSPIHNQKLCRIVEEVSIYELNPNSQKKRNVRKNCYTMTGKSSLGYIYSEESKAFSFLESLYISLQRLARIVKLLALFISLTLFPNGIRIPEK